MQVDEAVLWERLAHSRRAPVEPNWLGEIYSPSLSVDLRRALCEKLGMLAERGWPVIDQLVQRHGVQPDLVMAAGLCHQTEARDWLLTLLQPTADNAMFNLCVVEALGCWGADVPEDVVIGCLQHPGQHQRLAGLQLLSFRAHCLNDGELLNLCQEALDDFRDPIVVAAIRLLQRRDGDAI
ncbi:MAG: capsid protein, partial [Cyanobium sp. MED843]|nr:capsid protein [Cyanobium sp. MED843]